MKGDLQTAVTDADLGTPALVCRWRLAGGRLPLANRHLRALRGRELGGRPMPAPLVAWAREHIDWTLERGAAEHPDGVLMLVVDEGFRATMAIGPYQPLAKVATRDLIARARESQRESARTRVAPETLWFVRDGAIEWLDDHTNVASGAASLVSDLASTLGLGMSRREVPAADAPWVIGNESVFLSSDEHGVVVPSDQRDRRAQQFVDAYQKLLESTMRRQERRRA